MDSKFLQWRDAGIPQENWNAHRKFLITKSVCLIVLSAIFLLFTGHINSYATTLRERVNTLTKKAEDYSKKQEKHSLALIFINKAIKLQPRNANLYYKRAFIIGRAGQYHYAIKEFSRFVNNKNFSHAVRFRADCFMALNQMQRAVNDYTAFLKRKPKDGKVWSYLVEALALMGKRKAALNAIHRGLATGSHWSNRLTSLQKQILLGKKVIPHRPLSN